MGTWQVTLAPLLVALVTVVWVYQDAHRHEVDHRPVQVRVGALELGGAGVWAACCVVLWIVFFPLYLVARRSA